VYTAGAPVNPHGGADAKEMTPECSRTPRVAWPHPAHSLRHCHTRVRRGARGPRRPFDAEQSLPPQVKANLERAYGLDQPLATQYLRYLRAIAARRFRTLLEVPRPQRRGIDRAGPAVSLILGFAALLVALALGVPLGIWAALRRGRPVDHGIMGLAVLGVVLPSFVTGPLLVLVFGLGLHWLPSPVGRTATRTISCCP